MTNTPSSTDATTYLENLMWTGQAATKQFEDALALAMGVHGEEQPSSANLFFPFALIADL